MGWLIRILINQPARGTGSLLTWDIFKTQGSGSGNTPCSNHSHFNVHGELSKVPFSWVDHPSCCFFSRWMFSLGVGCHHKKLEPVKNKTKKHMCMFVTFSSSASFFFLRASLLFGCVFNMGFFQLVILSSKDFWAKAVQLKMMTWTWRFFWLENLMAGQPSTCPPPPTNPTQKSGFNKAVLRETNGEHAPNKAFISGEVRQGG